MFTTQRRIRSLFALLGMSFVASTSLVNCDALLPEPPSKCTPNEQQCTGNTLKVCGEDEQWAEETRYCSEVAQVVAGGWHACARFADGSVKCWGQNEYGQLGQEIKASLGVAPSQIAEAHAINLGAGKTTTAISAGGHHTCALLNDGSVKCWGRNDFGQLGQGNTDNVGYIEGQMSDLHSINLGNTAQAISAGGFHSCALLTDYSVKCWGRNDFGQLGRGDTTNVGDGIGQQLGDGLQPIDLGTDKMGMKVTAKAISAGGYHTCALLNDNNIKCWGYNDSGQLGRGDTKSVGYTIGQMGDSLNSIDLGMTAMAISAGGKHTCALLNDNNIKCWGNNASGRLGQGNTERHGDEQGEMGNNLHPIELGSDKTGKFWTATAISAGEEHTCVLLNGGYIKCWGDGTYGQPGQGHGADVGSSDHEMGDNLPPVYLGSGEEAVDVVAGGYFACARLRNGDVKCWGANECGQLGQGNISHRGVNADEMRDLLPIKLW